MENKRASYEDLNIRISRKGMVEKWADFFVKRLRDNMRRLQIRKSGNLQRSLKRELIANRGDVEKVFVKFALYGRFRDMGVGRGLKAYERGMNKTMKSGAKVGANVSYVNREPARWFNKTKTAQIHRLRELLEKELDHATVRNIKNDLQKITQYEIDI